MDININENDWAVRESLVKDLQSVLFPISPRKATSDSFLNNWYLKSVHSNNQIANVGANIESNISKGIESDLFSKDINTTVQPARWPTECQVLEERVNHIMCPIYTPESYYIPSGKEVQPKPVGDDCGIVIYQYYPISAVNYFSRSSVGGSKYLLSTCPSPEDDSLRFESRFESGNLAKAIKITSVYYELYLRTDLYTNRHMQWFYFRITNMKKVNTYRFSIVNLMKDNSLYNEGMRPLMYSVRDAHSCSLGWRRCGANIAYYSNDNGNPEDPEQIKFNTLTFTLEFPHDDDIAYLAHSYPYTYSDLQDYLQDLNNHPIKSTYTNIRLLCKSLAGNNVYYITVTSPGPNADLKKKAIVVTARVHPGETPASWMMKGILDFITSDSGPAKQLRNRFIFKIVPMLNPDGVIVGNNRCSLTGKDLNRQYRTVIRENYPSIWYTKLMIRRLLEECGVAMYCDLHAHSRKHNIFIYGCENRRNMDKRLQEQVFPLMLHKNAAGKFSFEDCIFRVQRNKEGTGRIVMWTMGINYSYTLEASFGGGTLGSKADNHFCALDYEQMGKSFSQTLLDFYDDDPRKDKLRSKIVCRLLKIGSNADEPANINLTDYSSDNGDTSSSTSDNEDMSPFGQLIDAVRTSPVMIMNHLSEKSKSIRQKRIKNRTVNAKRKPIQVVKTTLGLSTAKRKDESRDYETRSTNSDNDIFFNFYKKSAVTMKRKKNRNTEGRKSHGKNTIPNEQTIEKKSNENFISVLHMTPEIEFEKLLLWQESIIPNVRLNKRLTMNDISKFRKKSQMLKKSIGYQERSYSNSMQLHGNSESHNKGCEDIFKNKIVPKLTIVENTSEMKIYKEKIRHKNNKIRHTKKCKNV